MKKILVILSILGCFTASAQQPSVTPQLFKYDYYKFMGYLASDSGLMFPIRTPNFTPIRAGMSVFNTADTTLHVWSGYNWYPLATQRWVNNIFSGTTPATGYNKLAWDSAYKNAVFDTTTRELTLTRAGDNTTTTVLIPRGGSVNGITTLTPSRSGNIITLSGDNGSVVQFGVRDADSSAKLPIVAGSLNPLTGSLYTPGVQINGFDLSKKLYVGGDARVDGRLIINDTIIPSDYSLKVHGKTILDTLDNGDSSDSLVVWNSSSHSLRKVFQSLGLYVKYSDTATMLLNRFKISDTSIMLLHYAYKDLTNTPFYDSLYWKRIGSSLETVNGTDGIRVNGGSNGTAAFSGQYFNHVLVSAGYSAGGTNYNTLSNPHQVGFYSAISGNTNATGVGSFVAGFESNIGIDAGSLSLEYAAHFAQSNFNVGAGSHVGRVVTYMFNDDNAGDSGNVAIADQPTARSLTGNWFINYGGTRPSFFGGRITTDSIFTFNTDVQYSSNAGYGIISQNGSRVLAVTNSGISIPNFYANSNWGSNTVTAGNFNSGGDIQITSNAGYGILSQNGGRVLAIQNDLFQINAATTYFNGGKVGIGTNTPFHKLEVSGGVYADSIIKSGGTSTQFLKADGSVDGNTYLTTVDSSIYSTKANVLNQLNKYTGTTNTATVGALTTGSIGSGFGNINIGTNTLTAGDAVLSGAINTGAPLNTAAGVWKLGTFIATTAYSVTGYIIVNIGGVDYAINAAPYIPTNPKP